MSLAIFCELDQELKRLAIAGSDLAVGDISIKKYIAPLEKMGHSAPVCKKMAELLEQLVTQDERGTPEKLLELAALVTSVLYTQASISLKGEASEMISTPVNGTTTFSYRKLKPVIEAMTTRGSGRYEVIREANEAGLFQDIRLVLPAIKALQDPYPEIADYVSDHILPVLGKEIVSLLRANLVVKGGKKDARIIETIRKISGKDNREIYWDAIENGSNDVKVAAILALEHDRESESLLLALSRDKKKEVREAALAMLGSLDSELAVQRLIEAYHGKDREAALRAFHTSESEEIVDVIISESSQYLRILESGNGELSKDDKELSTLTESLIQALYGKQSEKVYVFLRRVWDVALAFLHKHGTRHASAYGAKQVLIETADQLMLMNTPEIFSLLETLQEKANGELLYIAFEASLRFRSQTEIFDMYAPFARKVGKNDDSSWAPVRQIIEYFIDASGYTWLRGIDHSSVNRLHNMGKRPVQEWDRRWFDTFIKVDDKQMAFHFCYSLEPDVLAFLLTKYKEKPSLQSQTTQEVLSILYRLGYSQTSELVVNALRQSESDKYGGWLNRSQELLKQLDPIYVRELKVLAERTTSKYLQETLYEISEFLSRKGDESS